MADTTPDQFTFTDNYTALLNRDYISDEITVAGIDTAANITITSGTYSKNDAAYTASAGTVVLGDRVRVKGTSSTAWGTAVNVVLTIGGVSDTFTIMTMGAPSVGTFSGTTSSPYILTEDSWIW
jgi:hypothetical protein